MSGKGPADSGGKAGGGGWFCAARCALIQSSPAPNGVCGGAPKPAGWGWGAIRRAGARTLELARVAGRPDWVG